MYTLEDLFDRRSPVGTRLEQILIEKKCTKAELSKKTGVSRPTIDKVLSGTITSKKNYETHMPLRYNNDKQKKPLFSRGLSVCRLLFNSFSKLKIDENYKEKRRLFY